VRATREAIARGDPLRAEVVAERAGVSVATFYGYFASKNEVLTAAVDAGLAELVTRLDAALAIERLLADGLAAVAADLIGAAVSVHREHGAVTRLARGRLAEDRQLRAVVRERQAQARSSVRRFLELGTAAGRIRQGDHAAMAAALLVIVEGLDNPVLAGLLPGDAAVVELAGMLTGWLAAGRL
jgi:AcrR family transcriptional regulator